MKKILIPTDFSPNAHSAATYALSLFGDSATYTLVNAYQVPHSGSTMLISISDILKRDSEQLLKEELIRLEDEFPQLADRISMVAEMGQADTALRKLAVNNGHDLIVMGTKGATGLKSVLIGSVAANVIQQVPCAVLAVPATAEARSPKRILFAADDHTLSLDRCPEMLAFVADRCGSEVLILNVMKDGERADTGGRRPINGFDAIPHSFHFESGKDVGSTITKFAIDSKVDLMTMVRRKKDLFSNLFGHSNTRDMMQTTRLPLLVLPSDQQ